MFGRVRSEFELDELPPLPPPRNGAEQAGRGQDAQAGPYDSDDPTPGADGVPGCVDFGSLRVPIPARAQLQVEKGTGELLRAVHVLVPSGRVSLSALAAPRSGPLWRGLAEEIAESLGNDGARVRSEWGQWGREVQAGSNGALSRFIGVDGARWMLYGVATGPAEGAPELADTLREMIRGTVVFRGPDPLPVKTVLPLRLPEHLEERVEQARDEAAQSSSRGRPPADGQVVPLRADRQPTRQPMAPRRPSAVPAPAPAFPPAPDHQAQIGPPQVGHPAAASHGPATHPQTPAVAQLPPSSPTQGSVGARRVGGGMDRRIAPPVGPVRPAQVRPGAVRPAALPPVPAYPAQAPTGVARAAVEATWSSANPVVSADQLSHQPAWALLSDAPSFWPDQRYRPAGADIPGPPDRGALDDARGARPPSEPLPESEPLYESTLRSESFLPPDSYLPPRSYLPTGADLPVGEPPAGDRSSEPTGGWSDGGEGMFSGTDSLHRVLVHDAEATRDWQASADRRGRHRRP